MDICFNLPKLERLWISMNQLSGNIPPSLGACMNLKLLSLQYNNFAGSIPTEIRKLSKLQVLYLGQNNLIGNILNEIGNLLALVYLDLGNNGFNVKLKLIYPTNKEAVNLSIIGQYNPVVCSEEFQFSAKTRQHDSPKVTNDIISLFGSAKIFGRDVANALIVEALQLLKPVDRDAHHFDLEGKVAMFSIFEFVLITGLQCTDEEAVRVRISRNKRILNEYFHGQTTVTLAQLGEALGDAIRCQIS
ncbi:probable leucine-rich repeat receptor-like protein kinase At2g33170 [Olea europaea var. sylvestris]|uniref:probable leucine-rich repeat receptor-like protein kinase At2g33170 n=1 Tax=Olea europaea var. sylvestris TaxID=158386 RepID=UPI000C1CEDBE|nr:probable leucine-rich repeat receptor-like protein kinase At2g33170 [Olea europaea var. sylvestris]